MKRLTDKEVRSQIYGVLASKLRMACVVDGDDIDVDRYHTIQMQIAAELERRYCSLPSTNSGGAA